MTLEAAFGELDVRVAALERCFDDVLWAIVQARSAEWSHAVIDHYEMVAGDIVGTLKQARAAAREAGGAATDPFDSAIARRALATCHACIGQAWLRFYGDLAVYERKSPLYHLRRRGREWASWVQGVDDALAQCPPPLYAAGQALLRCWLDLVEHAAAERASARAARAGAEMIDMEAGRAV